MSFCLEILSTYPPLRLERDREKKEREKKREKKKRERERERERESDQAWGQQIARKPGA